MVTKQRKSQDELVTLLMQEIRKYPECAHIVSVTIIRPTQMNWDAAWTMDGQKTAGPRAQEVAVALQAKFDLA